MISILFPRILVCCGVVFLALTGMAHADLVRLLHPPENLLMGVDRVPARSPRETQGIQTARSDRRSLRVSGEGLFYRQNVASDSAVNVELRYPEELDELEAVRNEENEFDLDRLGLGVEMEWRF
jgi:hypothetical protein